MAQPEIFAPLADAQFGGATVNFAGTAGATSTWPAGPECVAVVSTSFAYVAVGEGVTATTANGVPVPANTLVALRVPTGTGAPWRVSAIQVTTSGNLYAKPMNKE